MANLTFNIGLTEKSVNKQWTYRDLKTDVQLTPDKRDVKVSTDSDAIQNGIKNMFLFQKGERIINPEFGNNLYKYIYEPMSDLVAHNIGVEIQSMFDRWEPRVEINQISVIPWYDQNTYQIEVDYIIPSLSNANIKFETAINTRRE